MGFRNIFRRRPSRSFGTETSFSTCSPAQDWSSHSTHGGSSITSGGTPAGYASHIQSYSAAHPHPQNPPPAFTPELSAQHRAQSYSAAPSSSQSLSNRSTSTLTRAQAPAGNPTHRYRCRDCDTPFTLYRVRNGTNRHLNRSYYRCERCGDFRAWADMQGVYVHNPHCRCGEYSRFDQSKKGVWYFACAFKQCGFYAERGWRGEEGLGLGQGQDVGVGAGHRGGRVEMA